MSTLPYGLERRGRNLNKKSLLNSGKTAQPSQAGRVINISRLTDGYSHSYKKRVSEFLNSRLNLRLPSAVDVLLRRIAVGVLHAVKFSGPVDDSAAPDVLESSGASPRFRSSTRARVCWPHQCPTSTWTARL